MLLLEAYARDLAIAEVEPHVEARARCERKRERMADVVEVQAVEVWGRLHQIVQGLLQVLDHSGHRWIQPQARRSEACVLPVGRGYVVAGIVEQAAARTIDGYGLAAHVLEQRGVPVARQREHVEPGVYLEPPGVGAIEQPPQRRLAGARHDVSVGRVVCVARGEPGASAPIDLHQQIRKAQASRPLQQTIDAGRILQGAMAPLGQDPERAAWLGRGGGGRWSPGFRLGTRGHNKRQECDQRELHATAKRSRARRSRGRFATPFL